jgi:DNA repair protein RecN (Recombination protein N)
LGERADRALIRAGSDSCTVEALFDVTRLRAPLTAFLESNGLEPCEHGQLVLKRTFTAAGANRQFVNGSPTTLAVLAALGEWLVDIHGPHDHQSLLHPARQLEILDAFGKLEHQRHALADLVRRRSQVQARKRDLILDEKTYAQQLDLLRFQVKEIRAAELAPEEEIRIEQEHRRASTAARLLEWGTSALDMLSENDSSVLTEAGILGRTLQDLQRLDPAAGNLVELHEQASQTLRELQSALSRYADKLELDPVRLRELDERLNLIHSLKRKYGSSVAEILQFGSAAEQKLASLEQRDAELERINAQLAELERELVRAAQDLTAKRREIIAPLCKRVTRQLADLGFKQSRFEIRLVAPEEHNLAVQTNNKAQPTGAFTEQITGTGWDAIEFLFAPNPGEPPKPLRSIASSGELARVMLALKTVLAAEDRIPVLVFDEVDANVGGETARIVGEKMRQLAQNRQVLCITHLPQVAAPASAHFLASKKVVSSRTVSQITLLDSKSRVTELARMLGGQTHAAIQHAEALLNP